MAKHGRGSKKAWQTIEVQLEFDIGDSGLSAKDLGSAGITPDTADDNFIATSVEATYSINIEQAAEPNEVGPVVVGLAKSDYSTAEIEAWVENTTGFTRANLISQEISARHIRHVGMFTLPQVTTSQQVSAELNDGVPIKTRLNWRILEGTRIVVWLYNAGEVSIVASAGQNLVMAGQINGFWED